MAESRHSVRLAVTPWAEAHGMERLEPSSASEIQLDVLRRDPWSVDRERSRFLVLRAVWQLNPFLLAALVTSSESARPSRFYSLARGNLAGHSGTLCHYTSWAAVPFWLEMLPLGWIIGGFLSRVRLTFWQFRLTAEEAAPYAGTLSMRARSISSRGREVIQGQRLETVDRIFGHRAETSESVAFLKRYALIVADDAREVAVRDMFGPAFLVHLTERAPDDLFIELRGNVLSVGVRDLVTEPGALDELAVTAEHALTAVLDGAGVQPASIGVPSDTTGS